MIKLDNIKVEFGDFLALKEISLEVKEGEFFTLLGPSGCGKTTTLRSIIGFNIPSSGTVSVDGKDITHLEVEKRNIGMVFQSYAFFPSMTVYENIAFGLKLKKMSKDEINKKVLEIAEKVNLNEAQLKKKVNELSGGQQQRIMVYCFCISCPQLKYNVIYILARWPVILIYRFKINCKRRA